MKKLVTIAAGLAVVPVLAAGTVFADSPGDLAGGTDIYQVRNTNSSTYSNAASVACNETVKYSVKLSNTDYSQITNINVKASLTSGAMTASATKADGGTTTTSGNVSVTVTGGGSLSYVAGSTVLVSPAGQVLSTLSDGVTDNGVNAGSLNGSTKEYLQFQAKVNCQTPPKQIQVCDLSTNKVVTINESDFNSSKYSKDLTKCAQTTTPPTVLPNTGAGNVVGVVAGAIVAGTIAGRLFVSRKLARKV